MRRGWIGLLALCLAGPARGQEIGESVEVLVSRHAPSNVTGEEPIDVIGADAIARSSVDTLDQLLNKRPEFGSQGINAAQNDGGYGATFVDLRNLNFNRTLTLIDGERFVLSGIRTDEAVDFNTVPLGLVDRVEVLKDGSQPEYAADSVAGTVNVVLNRHVEGLTVRGSSGVAGAGDNATEQYEATWGRSFDGGSVALDAGFTNRDPVRQSNRHWSRDPITDAEAGSPLVIGGPASAGGHAVSAGGGVDAQLLGNGASRPFGAGDGYNEAGARYLVGGLRRYSLSGIAQYEVAEGLVADAEILFTHRASDTRLPPQTLGLAGTAKYPDGFVVPVGNAFNPFGQDVGLERVLTEAGTQVTHTEGPTYRVVLGLQGNLLDTDWRLSFNPGESHLTYRTGNAVNLAAALDTLDDGSADYFGPGTLTPANVARIRYTDSSTATYVENVARAVLRRPVASLPGGSLDLTVGGEWRQERGRTTIGAVDAAGDQASPDVTATGGGYDTREAFVDVDVPLLKDQPFARVLSVSGSARFTDTSRFGSFTTYKAVATYAPDAAVRLRATAGGARRPPAITEAFGGIGANFEPVTDPCDAVSGGRASGVVDANCRALGLGPGFRQAASLINVANGGNPNLKPEASENVTIGAVLTPPALPGLSLTADWYSYRIKNAIDSLADTDPNFIPETCLASAGLSSQLCPLIERGPSGQINRILALDGNIGTIKTSGVDVGLAWTGEVGGGRLDAAWDTTWLLDYRIHRLGDSGFAQYAGTFPGLSDVGGYARVRSTASLTYAAGPWTATWSGRLIGGARVLGAAPGAPFRKAPDITYHDVSGSWTNHRLTVTAGIDNLFDQAPPTLLDGVSNTNTNTYDVVGRVLFVRCSATF